VCEACVAAVAPPLAVLPPHALSASRQAPAATERGRKEGGLTPQQASRSR
jgi:hypothetical protein